MSIISDSAQTPTHTGVLNNTTLDVHVNSLRNTKHAGEVEQHEVEGGDERSHNTNIIKNL